MRLMRTYNTNYWININTKHAMIKSTGQTLFAARETDVAAEWRQNHHVTFPRYDCISPGGGRWEQAGGMLRRGEEHQTEDVFEC